jgi:oxygen-independent coproporphyrinogen-3 oxidase
MAKLPRGEAVPTDGLIPTPSDGNVPFSVYLHIPFCTVRCGYCDFNTYTSDESSSIA